MSIFSWPSDITTSFLQTGHEFLFTSRIGHVRAPFHYSLWRLCWTCDKRTSLPLHSAPFTAAELFTSIWLLEKKHILCCIHNTLTTLLIVRFYISMIQGRKFVERFLCESLELAAPWLLSLILALFSQSSNALTVIRHCSLENCEIIGVTHMARGTLRM